MLPLGLNLPGLMLLTGIVGTLYGLLKLRRYRRTGVSLLGAIVPASTDGLLLASLLGILYITLTPLALPYRIMYSPPNLVPFVDMLGILTHSRSSAPLFLGGNILMFVPFGFFAAFRWANHPRDVWRVTLAGTALSITVETLQLIIPLRGSNVDDVILNTLGTLLGGWLGYTSRRKISSRSPGSMSISGTSSKV